MDDIGDRSFGVRLMVWFTVLFFSTFLVIEIVQANKNNSGSGMGDTKVLDKAEGRAFYETGPRHRQCCPANRPLTGKE